MLIAFKFPKPPPYTDATAGAGATEDPVVPSNSTSTAVDPDRMIGAGPITAEHSGHSHTDETS
eukprot:SAG11_NODE_373_length_10031_cov_37.400020_12_plen_63_part_00